MPRRNSDPDRASARRLIIAAIRVRARHFWLSIGSAALYLIAQLILPLVSKAAIDNVVVPRRPDRLGPYVLGLIALALCRAVFGGLRKYEAGRLMAAVGNDIRERLFEHLQRMSFSFHDKLGAGQLMSRASSDVTMIETAVAMVPFFSQSLVLAAGGIIILFFLQPILTSALVVVVGVLAWLTLRRAAPIYPIAREMQQRVGDFSQFIEQRINGIRVVKGHGLEPVHREMGVVIMDDVHTSGVRLARLRGIFFGTFLAVPAAATLTVISLGSWLALRGSMTPGAILAFLQYLGALVAPIFVGAQALAIWPQATAGAARIAEVLDTRPDLFDPPQPKRLPSGPGTVAFEKVGFGYESGARVLHDVNLEIPGGTSVALVGLTGCGKSTVARLIPRFYDPRAGAVFLDGVNVNELRLDELRRAVSIVFEDTVLFTGSIRENIALGLPASEADIHKACELAQADKFIAELPEGYDTVVGEQGMSLSGGQRQRLAIARAILRDPRVLILDDAMSAVDPGTDEAIRLGLGEVMRDRTTIIIAHRVETLVLADRVILMDHGRVVADGRHEDLMRHSEYRQALGLSGLGVGAW